MEALDSATKDKYLNNLSSATEIYLTGVVGTTHNKRLDTAVKY